MKYYQNTAMEQITLNLFRLLRLFFDNSKSSNQVKLLYEDSVND